MTTIAGCGWLGLSRYHVSVSGHIMFSSEALPWMTGFHVKARAVNGYQRVVLKHDDGSTKEHRVHCLVMRAHGSPKPSPAHEVAHLDGNRRNNRIENLAWKTRTENEADKKLHGTFKNGHDKKKRILKAQDVAHIRFLAAFGMSFTALAKSYNMHRYSISRIVKGKRHGKM